MSIRICSVLHSEQLLVITCETEPKLARRSKITYANLKKNYFQSA